MHSSWSAEFGWSPAGDPGLQYYIGELLYKGERRACDRVRQLTWLPIEGSFNLAETHLLAAGDRDSARLLGKMLFEWIPANGEPAAFATRGVLP